jgi:N-acetylmuramoyl-L-alanine amidase
MRYVAVCADMSKRFALLILLCLKFCANPADAVSLNGQNYVSISDWARADHLDSHWLKRGDLFEATNRTTRLVFNVDSHYVEINGVQVALSFPVANQEGTPLVAQFDLDKTIRPLLFPSRYAKPETIKTICLDPGHGGKDTGNRVGRHYEKTYTILLGRDVSDELKKAGFNVLFTRTKDVFVDLPERPAYANAHGADLFVSLHFNATETDKADVKGPETYCITPVGAASSNAQGEGSDYGKTTANLQENNSLLLAYEVQKSLVQSLNLNDRGVRRARFAVLRDAKMPAILIESGYMSNPAEGKKIYTSAYRHELARAIAKGILAYRDLTAPATKSSKQFQKSNAIKIQSK